MQINTNRDRGWVLANVKATQRDTTEVLNVKLAKGEKSKYYLTTKWSKQRGW